VTIKVPSPDTQVDFASELEGLRRLYLREALAETVKGLPIPAIDIELAALVPAQSLSSLAGYGLRGEMVFPVPVVLRANPRLLGYYRLLYGYSQKEFYKTANGLGRFKGMEERGVIRSNIDGDVGELAKAMCQAGALLVAGIGPGNVSQLRLKFQVQHLEPVGHRMLQWTDEASTSAARTVA